MFAVGCQLESYFVVLLLDLSLIIRTEPIPSTIDIVGLYNQMNRLLLACALRESQIRHYFQFRN